MEDGRLLGVDEELVNMKPVGPTSGTNVDSR
jgi:hypothetical protein